MADSKKLKDMYDVIVVGGGPAGSTCATYCAMQGKKVLLVDRAVFPRDKTCGDATSGKSLEIMKELGIKDTIKWVEHAKINGVTFSSPKGTVINIESNRKEKDEPAGIVCRREIFDNLIFQNTKKYCAVVEGFFVNDVIKENGFVTGVVGTDMKTKNKYIFKSKIVVGADGSYSVVANSVGQTNKDTKHQVAAVRAYYDNVEGMIDQIELHFVEGIIPGYFWIFPLPDKKANVGIGMVVKDMKEKKINLTKSMMDIIEKHPVFKDRFKDAKMQGKVKSWFLPLGSARIKTYGNGFLLVGDAASLIDPFSGKGIDNSMISGKIAAGVNKEAFEKNDFSDETLKTYQKLLFDELGPSLDTSYNLQKWGRKKWLVNFIIDKAKKKPELKQAISDAISDGSKQGQFTSPLFYFRMILT